jgi:hypothetical protein
MRAQGLFWMLQSCRAFCLTFSHNLGNIGGLTNRCGVEQWQLVGLITRRSQVQVLPPLLASKDRQSKLTVL